MRVDNLGNEAGVGVVERVVDNDARRPDLFVVRTAIFRPPKRSLVYPGAYPTKTDGIGIEIWRGLKRVF